MKYIEAEKLIAEIERLLDEAKNDEEKAFAKIDAANHIVAVTKTSVCVKIKKLIASLQQEQPEVEGVVHHVATVHYLETNNEQLNACLKQFDEGAEVVITINARKEEEK